VEWAADLSLPAHLRSSRSAAVAVARESWLASCQSNYMAKLVAEAAATAAKPANNNDTRSGAADAYDSASADAGQSALSTLQLIAQNVARAAKAPAAGGRSACGNLAVVKHGGVYVQRRQDVRQTKESKITRDTNDR